MRTLVFFFVLFCCLVALGQRTVEIPDPPEPTEEERQKAATAMKAWQAKRNGDFKIRVKIQDEAGKPITNVSVESRIFISQGWEGKSIRDTKVVSGAYTIEHKGCLSVALSFSHVKYHREKLRFDYLLPTPSVKIENGVHVYDETVVLHDAGEVAQLTMRSIPLSVSPKKGTRVIQTQPFFARDKYMKKVTGKIVEDKGLRHGSEVSYPRLFLELVPSKKPVPAMMQEDVQYTPKDAFLEVVLAADPTTGGFSVVPTNGRSRRDVMISMKTVPESGYQPRLRITPKALHAAKSGQTETFFYFKINGFYGKGYVSNPLYLHKKGEIKCWLNLFIQNDPNSRNVTTQH